eukprot:4539604-Prorocentrum_lima.AAC.1
MTSSLVGSEMCIRDRQWPSELQHNEWSRSLLECRAPLASRRPRPRGSGSVSYTHLTLPTICSV